MFGLIDRDIRYIMEVLQKFDEIETAIIFGSRAMGNYKKGSDIDIAILGKQVTDSTIYKLDDYLNQVYPIPYFFDIINYSSIKNSKLIEHINKEGKIIYSKKAS